MKIGDKAASAYSTNSRKKMHSKLETLKQILAILSVGENCTCGQCQAARMLAKLIKEIEDERKPV